MADTICVFFTQSSFVDKNSYSTLNTNHAEIFGNKLNIFPAMLSVANKSH